MAAEAVEHKMLPQGESFIDFGKRLGLPEEIILGIYTSALIRYREEQAHMMGVQVDDLRTLPQP